VPELLAISYRRRLASLAPQTRHALLVVDLSRGDAATAVRALAAADIRIEALAPAEALGLVSLEEGRFVQHPLVRGVIAGDATIAERQAVSAALADAAPEGSDETTWYRADAAIGTDTEVADALDAMASRIAALGGASSAVPSRVRAAKLTPAGPLRARRLVAAAHSCLDAGRVAEAQALLEESARYPEDTALRAERALVLAQWEAFAGSPERSRTLITATARELSSVDPEGAALMLTSAIVPSLMRGELDMAKSLAFEARSFVEGTGTITELLCDVNVDCALVIEGRYDKMSDAIDRVLALSPFPGTLLNNVPLAPTLCWLERFEDSADVLDGLIAASYADGALPALAFHLGTRAQVYWRWGRWTEARSAADEARELGQLMGQPTVAAYGSVWLAQLAAVRGDGDRCREFVDEVEEASARVGRLTLEYWATHAESLLEIGLGDYDHAARRLVDMDRRYRADGTGSPTPMQYQGDLIEALVRAGRETDAARATDRLRTAHRDAPSRYGAVMLARGAALLAGDDDRAEPHFQAAIDASSTRYMPFETARSQLLYGEWLRRRRRYRDARPYLRSAHHTLVTLRALPWAERAAAELRAAGVSSEPPGDDPLDELTPQELQVALRVAQGLTNREVAEALFLSPKTVDYHLQKTFRKLGVSSRSQLTRLIAAQVGQPP
jgi:ATP/maltotriose-dependent transcriptional regulator MalT